MKTKIKDRVTDLIDTDFTCSVCGDVIKKEAESGGTGYAVNDKNEKICYDCCGDIDERFMIEHGVMTLYLTVKTMIGIGVQGAGSVSNWCATLEYGCSVRKGRHNIARVRYDVWFKGPDGHVWHGVQYGDDTQLCHCKRTKKRWKK